MLKSMEDNRYMSVDKITRAIYHLECEGYDDEAKAVEQLKARVKELEACMPEAPYAS